VLFFFNNSYSMPYIFFWLVFQQLHTNSGLECSGETEGNLIYPIINVKTHAEVLKGTISRDEFGF
jgi:hypothetical protein